jgi:integrase
LAREHSFTVASGVDPVDVRKKRERDAETLGFDSYLDRFVTGYLKEHWPDSWADAKARLVNHALPKLKGKAMPDITAPDIGDVLDSVAGKRALARNLYVLLNLMFSWAAAPQRQHIERSPLGGFDPPPVPRSRKRVLTPDEIVAAWRASSELPRQEGQFVRLLFCTLQRRNEVAQLPWMELREEEARWHMDGARAKNEEDHLVHLNDLAMAELAEWGWKRRGPVFPSGKGDRPISGFSKLKRRLDVAMLPFLQALADKRAEALGEVPEPVKLDRWTLHDIRRSGTTALEAVGIPIVVTEKILNHKSGEASGGVRKVYNLWAYEDEKRAALTAWGKYLEKLIAGADASSVIALAERGA